MPQHKDLALAGFLPAQVDRSLTGMNTIRPGDGFFTRISAYVAIRGREQQLIDSFGGIKSDKVQNKIRGVSKINPLGKLYHLASSLSFGPVAKYTGY